MRRCLPTRARALTPLNRTIGAPILAMLLAACVPDSQPLWPALTGEPAAGPYVPAVVNTDWPSPLVLHDGVFQPARLPAPTAGDGALGERLRALRGDLADVNQSVADSNRRLQRLRGTAAERSRAYVAIVARIDDALRAGPDPADPVLQRRWRQALAALDRLAAEDAALDRLVGRASGDAEVAAEIAEILRSGIDLSGATTAARDARDALLREAEATAGASAAMLAEAGPDLAAKRAYIAAERANLQILRLAIANGESYGISLANRAIADPSRRADPPAAPGRGDSPLVVIRFQDDDVPYAQPLYRAASLALERRADTLFTLVAVAPDGRLDRAREHSSDVRQTLAEMGLPEALLTEAAWIDIEALGVEVHLYVR